MQFPDEEAKIMELARHMARGLADNAEVYPAPPVAPKEMDKAVDTCEQAKEGIIAAQGALKQAYDVKDEAMAALTDRMKQDIRYAENTVKFDDSQLALIGWGGRRPATHHGPPGQTRSLKAEDQGEGWIKLIWKKPTDGGKVLTYRVECRRQSEEAWKLVETTPETESNLTGQERGEALEYRVVAMNKAGLGEASNTVSAML